MFDFDRLTAADLSRSYGRRLALRQVSFRLDQGDLVALVGPNGAGKSTLLGLLATLIRPSAGTIKYDDRTADTGGLELRSQIGFLSHDLQVYAELSARENLEFFGGLYSLENLTERVSDALDRAGLRLRADDVVHGYSRGMRQRLALERTLLHDPRLVLLDEPFTGLDENSIRKLRDRLVDLKNERRIVLLATHDLDLVDDLVDRALMLSAGELFELECHGKPLREQYREVLARQE